MYGSIVLIKLEIFRMTSDDPNHYINKTDPAPLHNVTNVYESFIQFALSNDV